MRPARATMLKCLFVNMIIRFCVELQFISTLFMFRTSRWDVRLLVIVVFTERNSLREYSREPDIPQDNPVGIDVRLNYELLLF